MSNKVYAHFLHTPFPIRKYKTNGTVETLSCVIENCILIPNTHEYQRKTCRLCLVINAKKEVLFKFDAMN